MKIIVQKFGGSSLKDEVGRKKAAKHILHAVSQQYKVVVVVSAMGRKGDPYATDTLLGLIAHKEKSLPKREIDLLMSCGENISSVVMAHLLNIEGLKTAVLTGAQAGIRTDNEHGNARITEIKPSRLINELKENDAIIVPGFQGISESNEITTLGRGGSDTSAAALGVALNAEYIDIFTDVEGMMTADPNMVENARPLPVVTYTEVCNMAYQGAKVIHPRAVEIAMQGKVPIRIRSTYSLTEGTLVTDNEKDVTGKKVRDGEITGIAYVSHVTQIKITEKKGNHLLPSKVFKAMAEKEISVDFINMSPNSVTYTVMDDVTEKAVQEIKKLGYEPQVERNCAKVSAVGAGMTGVPGVTAKIVTALAAKDIQILQSADSHTTIWVLVKHKDLKNAVNALHSTFQLGKYEN